MKLFLPIRLRASPRRSRVFASGLTSGNYEILCELAAGGGEVVGRLLQPFTRPPAKKRRELGAREDQYAFGGESGRAVIVSFPHASDYVFWERSSYTPWWDVSGVGVCYEFVECWGYGNMGCSEPMQDKENGFPESTSLRTARPVCDSLAYALSDPNYRIFRDEWVDEYYYLYPDAVGVRQVNLWANSDVTHEFIQPQYVMPPGVLPARCSSNSPAACSTSRAIRGGRLQHPGHGEASDDRLRPMDRGVMVSV